MLISCLKCYRFFILYIDITFFGGSCGHGCNMHCIAKKKPKKTKKPKNTKKKQPPQRTVGNVIFACNDRSLHRWYERRTKTSLSL